MTAKALLKTIKQRETNHAAEVHELNAWITQLEDLVKDHTNTFQHCPEGYVLNTKYPRLTNIGNGLQWEVKWVKQLKQGTVAYFTEDDSPGDTPHIVKVYAQPRTLAEPIEPFLYGWRPSSSDLQQPSIPSLRQRGSSMIGVSTLTYSGLGSLTHRGRKPKERSANGRHVQTLLHLPRICARVVWKQPTAHTNLAHSRTWVPFVRGPNLPAEAAIPLPLCVDTTM